MKKEIKCFLNEEDEKEVRKFVDDLFKNKKLRETDYYESGGLRVEIDTEDKTLFSIYRQIGWVKVKK